MEGVLRTRTVTAMVFGPLFVVAILAGPWAFASLLAVAVVMAARELAALLEPIGWRAPRALLPALAALAYAGGLLFVPWGQGLFVLALATWLVLLAWLVHPVAPRDPAGAAVEGPGAWAVHLIGAFYVGLLPSFLVRLQPGPWEGAGSPPGGAAWLLLSVVLVWASDSGAYLVGRRWGRRRLWPAVSPGKTLEGALGGLALSIVAGLLLARLWAPQLGPVGAAGFGAAVSIAAQVGDLVQSRIKRRAGVKDSGRVLPGHGGMLDRFDSLFFAAPLFCYYLRAFAR